MCKHCFTQKIVLYSYGAYSEENRKVNNCNGQCKSCSYRGERGEQACQRVNQRPQKSWTSEGNLVFFNASISLLNHPIPLNSHWIHDQPWKLELLPMGLNFSAQLPPIRLLHPITAASRHAGAAFQQAMVWLRSSGPSRLVERGVNTCCVSS